MSKITDNVLALPHDLIERLYNARRDDRDHENHEYEKLVIQLAKDFGNPEENLLHAALGLSGEVGEFSDAIKKHWAYGKELDIENVIEELSDCLFYITLAALVVNANLDDLMAYNMKKLKKRYPKGEYSNKQAQERMDKRGG